MLFGLHKAKPALLEAGFAIVCEGQIDLITAFEGRDSERHRAAGHRVHRPAGAAAQASRRGSRAVLRLGRRGPKGGGTVAARACWRPTSPSAWPRCRSGEDPDSLIRTRGAAAFAERIGAAQDFFDFQIERLGATFDLTTPLGKKQFAGRMAESVSLLTEPVLREAVVGKVSALLRISAQDFRSLLRRRNYSGARSGEVNLKASETTNAEQQQVPDAPVFEKPPKNNQRSSQNVVGTRRILRLAPDPTLGRGAAADQRVGFAIPRFVR